MAPGIAYDESGALASYFGVTCLALVLVPATYYTLKPAAHDHQAPSCACPECRAHFASLRAEKAAARRARVARRLVPLLAAWALLAYLAHGLYRAPAGEARVYNPFEILGIGSASTEKQIKKHYKKLSLQFHPDKLRLSENQTKEDAESHFVELTKAYKALTDEVTRENLAKYGNPDGPQQREDKIAIPTWVVEGKNSFWALGLYGAVLGLGIPYVVGSWWFRQRRLTRDGILNTTAETFFHQLREDTDFISLMSLLASAGELAALLGRRKLSKKEKKGRAAAVDELERALDARRAELGIDESPTIRPESRVVLTHVVARQARALLWAHLLRFDLDQDQAKDQRAILRTVQPVLAGLINIALAHNWLATSKLAIALQPALVQAVPAGISPLAQLPGIGLDDARRLAVVHAAEGKRWAEKFVKADKKQGVDVAHETAKTWFRLEIVSAEFTVTGEKVVTPGSIVNLKYTCRYVYPTTQPTKTRVPIPSGLVVPGADGAAESVAAVDDAVGNGDVIAEKDANAVVVIASSDTKTKISENVDDDKAEVGIKGKGKAGKAAELTYAPNAPIHAPRWPLHRKPAYYVLLGDSKLDKVIVQPQRVGDIPVPAADGTPAAPRAFSLQFQAPPQANLYSFVAGWYADSLAGADVEVPVMLKVEDAQDADDNADDISEPDEDSLAGQMALMRGEKVRPSGAGGRGADDDDDDDRADESGTDDEYESSSDDDEAQRGPRRGRAINEDTDSDSD
ncbi:secretory subunit [Cryptotrichosporon argae]